MLSNWLLADLSIINNLYLAAVALRFVCVGGNQPISAHSRPQKFLLTVCLHLSLDVCVTLVTSLSRKSRN